MLKKTITYTDFNDTERKEDFYFNLSEAEIMEMQLSATGGLSEMLTKLINTNNVPAIAKVFKEFILKAYGEKSDDGRRFIKSEEISKAFSEMPAYSILYMELSTNAQAAADFINGLIPKDLAKKVAEENPDFLKQNGISLPAAK